MNKHRIVILVIGLSWSLPAMSLPSYPNLIPNNKLSCSMCHAGAPNKSSLNDLGLDIQSNLQNQTFQWSDICPLDSDADGFSNGVELQDLDCSWTPGNPAPGDPGLVTNPADADSKPAEATDNLDTTDGVDGSTTNTDGIDGETTGTDGIASTDSGVVTTGGGTQGDDETDSYTSDEAGCSAGGGSNHTIPFVYLFSLFMLAKMPRRLA
ncbi:MAG: hypothetical protein VX223_15925 [Myxococcota bacterium]|nr:hypothetical protein [Myxococcota bacterium]